MSAHDEGDDIDKQFAEWLETPEAREISADAQEGAAEFLSGNPEGGFQIPEGAVSILFKPPMIMAAQVPHLRADDETPPGDRPMVFIAALPMRRWSRFISLWHHVKMTGCMGHMAELLQFTELVADMATAAMIDGRSHILEDLENTTYPPTPDAE